MWEQIDTYRDTDQRDRQVVSWERQTRAAGR